ncbi:exported hypothetical protein [Vibrio nigripulchritudo SOn1]|uniref:Secreted protein n=1 Tax=Vibrio nigripulchritudo SOn1 TaxID=1238450 RepID=A0AAV2W038_9VIBR|nr:hypothetical protein [Vibrio nigripulchritudo]CCO50258.1 exported hypothetical protein [Vibrio nigripulchritudo SOn1]
MNPTIISALLIGSAFLSGYATMRAEECNTADPLGNGYHDIQSADAPSLYSQHTTGCDDADEDIGEDQGGSPLPNLLLIGEWLSHGCC